MVEFLKNRIDKIESKNLWVVAIFLVMTLLFSWFMIAFGFNMVVQDIFYPYSNYPVVVHTGGEIILLPGWFFMWIIAIGGINHILSMLFESRVFKLFKEKINLLLVVMLILIGVVFVLDIVLWPVAAKANGYSPCPYDTLLFGQKISTAWSKNEAFCHDPGVQARLSTGTFEQVEQVAKYLEHKKK